MKPHLAIVAFALAASACSGANYNVISPATPIGSPTPSPAPSGSPPPTVCGAAIPGSILIAVGSYIVPQIPPDPTYGTVSGYALSDSSGNYALVARPIVLKPNDVVQFVNVDPALAGGAPGTAHSASGLQSESFPVPHTFSATAASATGTSIDNSSAWSTGALSAISSALCYSQRLQLPASGAYYFGDFTYYNLTNMRDVIVISPAAAS